MFGLAADDRGNFRAAFADSVRSKTEMLAYARLQCKNEFYVASDYTSAPREVLFEVRGRPHHMPDTDEFKCFFAMAQPYPSRNTAMYVAPVFGARERRLSAVFFLWQAEHVPGAENGERAAAAARRPAPRPVAGD